MAGCDNTLLRFATAGEVQAEDSAKSYPLLFLTSRIRSSLLILPPSFWDFEGIERKDI